MLENEIIKETISKGFGTSPDTVYGILVGILILAIIAIAYHAYKLQGKLLELNISTIEVLKDLNTSLLLLKEEGANHSDKLINHINHTREHIAEKIVNLENRINHG
jgi:hypothetical protein